MRQHVAARQGFTLIELLVVIAIISILASILFPVFARAREKGRQTACISNLRQMSLAINMYAQDYDEIITPGLLGTDFWHDLIYPYTRNRQIYACPSRKDRQMGYAVNPLIMGQSEGVLFDPSVKILIADCPPEAIGSTATSRGTEYWYNDMDNDIVNAPDDNSFKGNNMPERHNDGVNVGYADGHAKWAKESQINQPHMWIPGLETP
jgi:prepilin-type N-terminal cleavage/methylation domain-containing protein/prepilin-type processing-associated H-X9-DG protein